MTTTTTTTTTQLEAPTELRARVVMLEAAIAAMAEDGWLYFGPEGMSKAQRLCVDAYKSAQPVQPARCPACNGDDAQAPCAYPEGGQPGCLRDARLARSVPLTDAQIDACSNEAADLDPDDWEHAFARAIERAHGIGGGK